MSEYVPDKWAVVEMTIGGERVRRVMASWYGGYLGSDSWKLSSAINEVIDRNDRYEFHNKSGSTYIGYKNSYGMSGYAAGVFEGFKKTLADHGGIEIVSEYDLPRPSTEE